jgi:ABC-2 type transport system permease protein
MFFIAVPLSGALLKERQSGIYGRLRSLPVSRAVLMMGKMAAYVTVCVAQLILIGLIGLFVLPVLGTPPLEMGASAGGILLMAGSAILAAVGYGILLGTLTSSYEQASMLGPITIVIAAAIGGIMVPVYVMPELMQALSMLSPLAWGLNGFLDVFVRQGSVGTVFPEAMRLLAFGAACLIIAWLKNRRRWKTDVN